MMKHVTKYELGLILKKINTSLCLFTLLMFVNT